MKNYIQDMYSIYGANCSPVKHLILYMYISN